MSKLEYQDVTADTLDGHNASAQHDVVPSTDPALEKSHEHHHGHLHHDARAEKGREDEVVYSKGTTFERSVIPHQDPQDHDLHRRHHPDLAEGLNKGHINEKSAQTEIVDAEKGNLSPIRSEEDPQSHKFARFYATYRIFFHLFIWLVFTG